MDEVHRLLGKGRLIEAIKRYRELTGVGLKEAKDAVEALRDGGSLPPVEALRGPTAGPTLTPAELQDVKQLVEAGRTIEAIKLVRLRTNIGLKEAKDAVDALRDGHPVTTFSVASQQQLPMHCPICGAAVNAAELKWVSPDAAECAYCGYHLRAQ